MENKAAEKSACPECAVIPEGCFEGNCSDCFYRGEYWGDGEYWCTGPYGGHNAPSDRNGCIWYK